MYMIEIEESKVDRMSELAQTMLRAGGQLMECIEECSDRGSYGERHGRDWDERDRDHDRDFGGYGERRGVRGTGRYSRFR